MANEDEETSEKLLIDCLPNNDYGPVRERRDFQPLNVSLTPILPCPFREYKFTSRNGWRYYPNDVAFTDRLGIAREFQDIPSTAMTVPESWLDKEFSKDNMTSPMDDASRKRIQDLYFGTNDWTKRQKLDGPTVVTNGSTSKSNTGATVVSFSSSSNNSSNQSSKQIVTTNPDIVPKAALYVLYGKKPRKTQLSGKAYLTWSNGARTHELKYTSIFVCPITKEVFLAGKYGDTHIQDGSLVWYSKKILAEHAVAARVYDCYILRDGIANAERLGFDRPYKAENQPIIPLNQIPPKISESIQASLNLAKEYSEKLKKQQEKKVPSLVRPKYSPPSGTTHSEERPPHGQGASYSYSASKQYQIQEHAHSPPPPPRHQQQNQARNQNTQGNDNHDSRNWYWPAPSQNQETSRREWGTQHEDQRGQQQQWGQQYPEQRGKERLDEPYSYTRSYPQNDYYHQQQSRNRQPPPR